MTDRPPAPLALVVAALVSVYLIWGSTYLAILFAIETMPPFLMAGARWVLAGGAMYAFLRLRGEPAPSIAHWKAAAVIGALLIVGGNGSVTLAEQWVPSGLTALLIATVPLWLVAFEWARTRERPRVQTFVGLAGGIVGVGMLVGDTLLDGASPGTFLGVGLIMLACVSWAFGSIHSKRVPLPASPLVASAMQMIAGGALLLVLGAARGEAPSVDLAAVSARSWVSWGFLVVFGSVVAYTAYVWLLKVAAPERVGTYAFVNPVVAVVLGWALADEAITPRAGVAAAIVVISVAVIILRRRGPQKEPHARNAASVTAPASSGK